ncbi:unnamed protein product [Symbiodinium necroappetens]|uniref:Uncharacterized protein n=1 Tax=Symbiodinium necroappetens TaxID=1628268 RepID=A0A812S172_9DINO|nr:unnamed protein product [Symbiodinium necroappetens]
MALTETMGHVGLRDIYSRIPGRRPEPGEDFEDLLLPSRVESSPERRVPGIASPVYSRGSETETGDGLRRASSETFISSLSSPGSPNRCKQGGFAKLHLCHPDRFGRNAEKEVPDSPSAQALAAMVERLHDEELRKREERKAARTFEREQEFCRQAPFAPTLSRASRCASEPRERHLALYDQRLEMAQRRRQRQEQKLREERDYREANSVHRARSPQVNPTVYQRLHEDAELKRRQRRNDMEDKDPPARGVTSDRQLKLYEQAVEAAEKRRAMQQEKLEQEQRYLESHSVHRARSPQADIGVISQRLYEDAKLKKLRRRELQREQELKDVSDLAGTRKKPSRKDEAALVERLFRPERRQRQAHLREDEEEWLQQRRRFSLPQRAVSFQGRFHSPPSTPSETPKASSEVAPPASPSSSPTTQSVGPLWGALRDPPGGLEDVPGEKLPEGFGIILEGQVNEAAAVAAEHPSANVEKESSHSSRPASASSAVALEPQELPQTGPPDPASASEKRRLSLELEAAMADVDELARPKDSQKIVQRNAAMSAYEQESLTDDPPCASVTLNSVKLPQEAMPVTKTSSQGRNLHDNEFVGGFGHPSLWGSPPGMSCNGFGLGGLGDLLASLPRSALRVSGGGPREGRKPWSFKRSGSERMEAGGVSHKPKQPKQPKQPSECSEPSEPKYHRAGTRGIQTAAALAAQSGSKRQGSSRCGRKVSHSRGKLSIEAGTQLVDLADAEASPTAAREASAFKEPADATATATATSSLKQALGGA